MYILIVISFFQLIWFILNTGMTFLFWNHSIIAQHVLLLPLKVPHREIEFWIVFMFLYLFIHSFTYSYFFYYYLFVSLYLIYINQVWHFCLKSFNNSPACIYFHSKCLTARLSLNCIYVYLFIHSFTYSYFFFTIIYLFHLI